MAQSIFQKLNLLFQSTLHDIVNKALQSNPIAVLNEHLREHEEALNQLEMDMGVTGGRVKTAARKLAEYQQEVLDITADIERILTDANPNNDDEANALSTDLVGKEDLVKTHQDIYNAAKRSNDALVTAREKLRGRIISLKNQIALLKAIQAEADVKDLTADVLIRSANMISSGVTSVEGLAETIKQNRDKADARFELALDKINATKGDTLVQSRADEKLAAIRERLGVKANDGAAAGTSVDMTEADRARLLASQ